MSGPPSTAPYLIESIKSTTESFAAAESPAIGRYVRSAVLAGRARFCRCLWKILLNTFTTRAPGRCHARYSLSVSGPESSASIRPSRCG